MVKPWIRKAKNLVAATFLGLALTTGACGIEEEGIPIKGHYEYTQESQESLEEGFLYLAEHEHRVFKDSETCYENYDPDVPCIEFEGIPKAFTNHYFASIQKDLGNAKLILVPRDKVQELCNKDNAAGCYKDGFIIIPEGYTITKFSDILNNHEIWHHLCEGQMEFVTRASEAYGPIEMYHSFERIGSLMLYYSFQDLPPATLWELNVYDRMYNVGDVFALINLIEHNGDIKAALDDVCHSRILEYEIRIGNGDVGAALERIVRQLEFELGMQDQLSGLLGMDLNEITEMNLDEADFHLRNILLELPGFKEKMNDPELLAYLKILNYHYNRNSLSGDSLSIGNLQFNLLLDSFELNEDFTNPYFRAEVVWFLTDDLSKKIRPALPDKKYILAKRIIDAHSDYPCENTFNPYTCPKIVRPIRIEHVAAFYHLVPSAYLSKDSQEERMRKANDDAIYFIEKFYPEVDFKSGDFSALGEVRKIETNNYLSAIAYYAGFNSLTLYTNFNSFTSEEKEIELAKKLELIELARKFLIIAVTIRCLEDGWGIPLPQCEYRQKNAQTLLDHIERNY